MNVFIKYIAYSQCVTRWKRGETHAYQIPTGIGLRWSYLDWILWSRRLLTLIQMALGVFAHVRFGAWLL